MSFGFGFGFPSQASATGGASLSLNFAGATSLDPKITFTRASTGSYYGSDGLLALSPVNLLTYSQAFDNAAWTKSTSYIQTNLLTYSEQFDNAAWTKSNAFVQTNLLLYSEQFDNAAWTKRGTCAVTANAITAPDGTTTADLISGLNTSPTNDLFQASATVTLDVPVSPSFYINKVSATGTLRLANPANSTKGRWDIDLSLVPSGWQRITVGHPAVTVAIPFVGAGGADGLLFSAQAGGPLSFYLWGAQLVQGSSAGDYQATTTAAAAVQYASPTGSLTADKLVETTATGGHLIDESLAVVNGTVYANSAYIKAGERTIVSFRANNDSSLATFNLSTGAVSGVTNATAEIVNVGGGWYRCSLVWTATSTASVIALRIRLVDGSGNTSYTGDGTSGIYIWGAQLVQGAVAGDYQVTTTAAAAVQYTAPDGTLTAEKLVPTVTDAGFVDQSVTVSLSAPYAFAVYAKAGGLTQVRLQSRDIPNAILGTFDLVNGTATLGAGGSSVNISPVGNGWFRCVAIYTATGSSTNRHRIFPIGTADSTSGIYIWGAQLQTGTTATTYIPTTATASGAPRFDYDPAAILQQNLLTYSEQFDNAAWAKINSTVTANAAVSPDGTTTAESLTATTNAAYVASNVNYAVTSYQISFYVKAGTGNVVWLYVRSTAANGTAYFDLSDLSTQAVAGTFSTPSNLTITSVGSGWYRVSATFNNGLDTFTGSGVGVADAKGSLNATSGKSIFIWGAQLNTGSTALPYLATTSSALTVTGVQPKGLLIEEQRTNLLTYSEQFDNAAWAKVDSSTSANSVVSPDGTISADKIIPNVSSTTGRVQQNYTGVSGTTYTLSVFAKAGEFNFIRLYSDDSASNIVSVYYNVLTGTVTSGPSASGTWTTVSSTATNAGNGWWRLTLTWTATGAAPVRVQYWCSNTGNGTSGLYIWGAQLEAGAFATSYIPSTNTFTSRASTATYYGSNGLIQTAATNVARYNYNPANLTVAPTLLLENAATNLLTYSEQFDNAAWTKGAGVTVTANSTVAPDGTLTADNVAFATGGSVDFLRKSLGMTVGVVYTMSVYALRVSGTPTFNFDIGNGGGGASTAQTPTTTWQRFTFTFTFAGANSWIDIEASGPGTIAFWGAQLEAGSGATSYIPTVASQVTRAADLSSSAQTTRAADNAVMTGTNFSSWFNAAEGTVFAEYSHATTSTNNPAALSINANVNANEIVIYGEAAVGEKFFVRDGGVIQANITASAKFSTGVTGKLAGAYKANDFAASANGAAAVVDTSGSIPTVTQMNIGNEYNGSLPLNGHIRTITYWPRRLSNTELQGVTA